MSEETHRTRTAAAPPNPAETGTCPACGSRHLTITSVSACETDRAEVSADVQCRRCRAMLRIGIADTGSDPVLQSVKSTVGISTTVTTPGRASRTAKSSHKMMIHSDG